MRVKISEDRIVKVHKFHEEEVLNDDIVWCHQVDCIGKDIVCSECYFDGLGDGTLSLVYSEVKVGLGE